MPRHSVWAIHLHTEGGDRPPTLPHAARGEHHHSKAGQCRYRAFGSTGNHAVLLDEMSDDSVMSHLDRDGVKLLHMQEVSACASVVLVLLVRMFLCLSGESVTVKSFVF